MPLQQDRVRTGDLVSLSSRTQTEAYEVIAIHGDKCWIRHHPSGDDQIVPLGFCTITRTFH